MLVERVDEEVSHVVFELNRRDVRVRHSIHRTEEVLVLAHVRAGATVLLLEVPQDTIYDVAGRVEDCSCRLHSVTLIPESALLDSVEGGSQ